MICATAFVSGCWKMNMNMVVAELMGHANAQMVGTVYSHMHKATDHLKEALRNAAD
jgi:integrase